MYVCLVNKDSKAIENLFRVWKQQQQQFNNASLWLSAAEIRIDLNAAMGIGHQSVAEIRSRNTQTTSKRRTQKNANKDQVVGLCLTKSACSQDIKQMNHSIAINWKIPKQLTRH